MSASTSHTSIAKRPLLWSFVAAFLMHLVAYLVWGLYYNEYSDKFFTAYVDGSFDAGQTKALFYNYGFFTAISQVMAWMYRILPAFNWYGIFGQGLLLLTSTGFLLILWSLYRATAKYQALFGLLSVVMVPFWLYHIVLYRTTELSFLAFGISVFVLMLSFTEQIAQHLGSLKRVRAFFLILLLLSAFIRVEPVLMSSVIWLPYAWILWQRKSVRGSMLKVAVVALVGIGVAYGLYMSSVGPGSAMFKEIRVYTHTIWDFGQDDAQLHLATAADSIKLKAAQEFFISDRYEMDGAFYQSIGILPLEKSLSSLPGYLPDLKLRIDKALNVWSGLIAEQWVMFTAVMLLYLALSLLLLIGKQWGKWAFLTLLQLWFWAILFGITVFMKMELRVFCPLVTLDMILLIWLAYQWVMLGDVSKPQLAIMLVAGVLLGGTSVFKYIEMQNIATDYNLAAKNIKAFKKELLTEHGDKTVFFNSICWQMLYADLFDNNELQAEMELLAIDNGELYMYPSQQQTLKDWCGSDKLGDVAKSIEARKENIVFISSIDRMVLIRDYLNTVYGVELDEYPAFEGSVLSKPPYAGQMMPTYMEQHRFSYFLLR